MHGKIKKKKYKIRDDLGISTTLLRNGILQLGDSWSEIYNPKVVKPSRDYHHST